MRLQSLELHNFRNIKNSVFSIGPSLTVFLGDNAQGKTNCIEAVFFLINGTGFRESREEELVYLGRERVAYVQGIFEGPGGKIVAKVGLVQSGESYTKSFFINKTKKQLRLYRKEQLGSVLFAPEHIEMLTGSPDKRRSYFNKFISQYDYEYKKNLDAYERAVRRRNKILEHHENVFQLQDEIVFWNELCIKHAAYITKVRSAYCEFLNIHQSVKDRLFKIEYVKNEFNHEKLKKYEELEQKTRRTMFGPQKDDFVISLSLKHTSEAALVASSDVKGKNIQKFGSRSEQRLALMWLKLGEIHHLQEVSKQEPVLLLDDVFSEFDHSNKELILDLVKQYQTIASTTDMEIVTLAKKHKIPTEIIKL